MDEKFEDLITENMLCIADELPTAGFVPCDGRVLARKDYPILFQRIGTKWGSSGNGAANFSVPDFRGQFLRGWGDNRRVGSLQDSEVKSHLHEATCEESSASHSHGYIDSKASEGSAAEVNSFFGGTYVVSRVRLDLSSKRTDPENALHSHEVTVKEFGGDETRPANLAVKYAIISDDILKKDVLNQGSHFLRSSVSVSGEAQLL